MSQSSARKARWIASHPSDQDYNAILLRDVCSMPSVAVPPAAWHREGKPDRRALEAYREFLFMEGKLLGTALYPEQATAHFLVEGVGRRKLAVLLEPQDVGGAVGAARDDE